MERWEIEARLSADRAWLVEKYASLTEEELHRPATKSEHDPNATWSALDHLAHLSLIERDFVNFIRRHLAGHPNPVGLLHDREGRERPREEIMKGVHAATEAWRVQHRDKDLGAVLALGQEMRAGTLQLLSELSDEQLAEKLPGAPWGDGTIGGVLAANGYHGRVHFKWVKDGWAERGYVTE